MIPDKLKTKSQLINELKALRRSMAEQVPVELESCRRLMTHSSLLIQQTGPEGKFHFVSSSWHKILGYSAEDITGLTFFDILHPAFVDRGREFFDRVLAGEHLEQKELTLLVKGGGDIIVSGDFCPCQGEKNVTGIIACFRDIGREKRMEEELRAISGQYRRVLEIAGLGTWEHCIKTGEIERDSRWAEMLGYRLEELNPVDHTWKSLIHPDDLPEVNRVLREHSEGRSPYFRLEHRMRTKNGEWKRILNCGKVVERDENGRPLRAVGVHMDIDWCRFPGNVDGKAAQTAPDGETDGVGGDTGDLSRWRGSGTLLLVDDDQSVLDVCKQMLQRLGFDILTAPSGHDAVEIFKARGEEIRCVLLDMFMPDMDGMQTFRKLYGLDDSVCVILASGYDRDQVPEQFIDVLPAGYIKKPYRLPQLVRKLKEVLDTDTTTE